MLTTAGETFLAMSRKVLALTVPVSGALFIGGAAVVWAIELGDNPKRDAITIPTRSDVSTTGTRYRSAVFLLDISASQSTRSSGRYPGRHHTSVTIACWRGPVTIASRRSRYTLISDRTPKSPTYSPGSTVKPVPGSSRRSSWVS